MIDDPQILPVLRVCSLCGESKPTADFSRRGAGLRTDCKACCLNRAYAWQAKNPEKRKATSLRYIAKNREKLRVIGREHYRKDPERFRANSYQTLYRITIPEYDSVLLFQRGVCAGCGRPPGPRRLAVDHDHKTGLIRGLLCWRCNNALGKIDDDISRLRSLVGYLETPPATVALGSPRYGLLGRAKRKKKMVYGPPI